MRSTPAPRGAALILALVVLVGLLFLALPFLFSQSASVAGARAAGYGEEAARGQRTVEQLGIAAASYAAGLHLVAEQLDGGIPTGLSHLDAALRSYSTLEDYVESRYDVVGDGAHPERVTFLLNESQPKPPSGAVPPPLNDSDDKARLLHGLSISDQQALVDPNQLSSEAWGNLLRLAGIADDYDPPTWQWVWTTDANNKPNVTGQPWTIHNTDPHQVMYWGYWRRCEFGRLAYGLFWLRDGLSASGDRITTPDLLLSAKPRAPEIGLGGGGTPQAGPNVAQSWALGPSWKTQIEGDRDNRFAYRKQPLTRMELERLRPYFATFNPAQGRAGLVDLGTVLKIQKDYADGSGNKTGTLVIDAGTGIWWSGSYRVSEKTYSNGFSRRGFWLLESGDPADPVADIGQALGMEVPAPVNVNLLGMGVGTVAKVVEWDPGFTPSLPFQGLHQIPYFGITDPRLYGDSDSNHNGIPDRQEASDYKPSPVDSSKDAGFRWNRRRIPVGVSSWGVVAVDSAATSLDPQGRPQADRARRVIAQAVPGEWPLESRWTTQAEMEAWKRLGHGSGMVTGPWPLNRVTDFDDPAAVAGMVEKLGKVGTPGEKGWWEPAPLMSITCNDSVTWDWWASFGLQDAASLKSGKDPRRATADIGKAYTDVNSPPGDVPLTAPDFTQDTVFGPQGVKLTGSDLSYKLEATNGHPLLFQAGNITYDNELAPRHQSLRFRLEANPSGVQTIAEVKSPTLPMAPSGNLDPDNTNLWRIEYDTDNKLLKLVVSGPVIPFSEDALTMQMNDRDNLSDITTDVTDDRCKTGATSKVARTDPVKRVEYRYFVKGGLVKGRWYHVQTIFTAARPGCMALILDGVVGRDLTASTSSPSELGDHYVFPSLTLTTDLPATASTLDLGSLSVRAAAGLPLTDVLPARGMIRVGDEYISYASISGSSLQNCRRGKRQDTVQNADVADPAAAKGKWPTLQAHKSGDLAVPGWCQERLTSGRLYRGGGKLAEILPKDLAVTTLVSASPTDGTIAANTVVTVAGGTWPAKGYVRIHDRSYYYENGGGTQITIIKPAPWEGTSLPWVYGVGATPAVLLLSVQLNASGGSTDFPASGAFQLVADDGRCEWMRYEYLATEAGATYFAEINGFRDPTVPPLTPRTRIRGSMRTFSSAPTSGTGYDWPADTTVLPVQTGCLMLEAGDVVTLVPYQPSTTAGSERLPAQMVVRYAACDGLTSATETNDYDTVNSWYAFSARIPDTVPVTGFNTQPLWILVGQGWSGNDLTPRSGTGYDPGRRRGVLPRLGWWTTNFTGSDAKWILHPAATVDMTIDDLAAGPVSGVTDGNAGGSAPAGNITAVTDLKDVPLSPAKIDTLPVRVVTNGNIFSTAYGLVLIDGDVFAYRRVGSNQNQADLIAHGLLGSTAASHTLPDKTDIPQPTAGSPGPPVVAADPNAVFSILGTLPILRLPLGPVGELMTSVNKNLDTSSPDEFELCDRDPNDYADYVIDAATMTNSAWAPGKRQNYSQSILTRAPAHWVQSADGTKTEIARFLDIPYSRKVMSAPWLRGLYNTDPQAFTANWCPPEMSIPPSGPLVVPPVDDADDWKVTINDPQTGLNPIVIGYWPRYLSPLPASLLSGDDLSRQWRSRVHPWVDWAMALHQAVFDPAVPVLSATSTGIGLGNVQIEDGAGLSWELRALAPGATPAKWFDWANSTAVSITATATPTVVPLADINKAFDSTDHRFQNRAPVGSVELRLHWSATAGGSAFERASAAQSVCPRVGAARLRCVARPTELAVEGAR